MRASNAQLRVVEVPARRSPAELRESGRRLAEVLTLAEALPYRPGRELSFPPLPAGTHR